MDSCHDPPCRSLSKSIMKQPTQSFDLSPLSADYEIVGEQDGVDGVRRYVATRKGDTAKRRDDQPGVLITVFPTPEGDEANALSHLFSTLDLDSVGLSLFPNSGQIQSGLGGGRLVLYSVGL